MAHPQDSIASGRCHCGCGELTNICTRNSPSRGWVKGQPYRFVAGHQRRTSPVEYLVDEETGCWIWQRTTTAYGYGWIRVNGKGTNAHRAIYERLHGPVPPGLVVDHLCRNRICVNPDHLEVVTQTVNVRRGTSWLTPEDVREIRALAGVLTHQQIADRYALVRSSVTHIIARHSWDSDDL